MGIITLQHVIQTIAGGFNGAFWWYGPLSEHQEILKIYINKSYPPQQNKMVADLRQCFEQYVQGTGANLWVVSLPF